MWGIKQILTKPICQTILITKIHCQSITRTVREREVPFTDCLIGSGLPSFTINN